MARVVKKVKKQKEKKEGNDKLALILGGVAAGLAVVCAVVFLVIYFQANSIDSKYEKSRQMDFDTLQNVIVVDEKDRNNYEKEFYVLVFHSDYELYPDNVFSDSTESRINNLIQKDAELQESYDKLGVSMYDRFGFYTLDLMDEDNTFILNNPTFGEKTEGPFLLKINGTTATVVSGSLATNINSILDTVNEELTANQDK